jgi:hypothetical protein
VILAYQQTATAVIQRYDGHLAQYMGDGILAYFGWPQAHENDAVRAVQAGLSILRCDGHAPRLAQDKGIRRRFGSASTPVWWWSATCGAVAIRGTSPWEANIAARFQGLQRLALSW